MNEFRSRSRFKRDIAEKYESYRSAGHLVLAVTLSTFIKSEQYAASDRMRHMWEQHFLRRVRKRLPKSAPLDYDWIVERSPLGHFHYHGFLAVTEAYGYRIWKSNRLNKRLFRDLRSFSKAGKYRPFRINSFLIEPVHTVDAWARYITKESINEY